MLWTIDLTIPNTNSIYNFQSTSSTFEYSNLQLTTAYRNDVNINSFKFSICSAINPAIYVLDNDLDYIGVPNAYYDEASTCFYRGTHFLQDNSLNKMGEWFYYQFPIPV